MKLTWLGCASYKIECSNLVLWTDPFITMAPNADHITSEETFADAFEILLSHGHFDHALNVPDYAAKREIRVHCTNTPCKTLLRRGVPEAYLHCCTPGDAFDIGDAHVRVFQGRHNVPDWRMTVGAVWRSVTSLHGVVNILKIANVHKAFPEAGETVLFEINCGGERILSMGSPGLPFDDADAVLPEPGMDLLILPYQGLQNPAPLALRIVETLRPKAVILSHHDNAIPPLTAKKVHIEPFLAGMHKQYPEIVVYIPRFGETVTPAEVLLNQQAV